MSNWTVVPSLLTLRDEFNKLSPKRDKGSDGTIGDTAHTSSSDHTPDEDSKILKDHDADSKNEVHALDIDSTGPWPSGRTFAQIIAQIIANEKIKWASKTDKCRINYVIFNDKIYDKDNDFNPRAYLPGNASRDRHIGHAHFSARYETQCENDIRPWGVYPVPSTAKPTTNTEKVTDMTAAELAALNAKIDNLTALEAKNLEATRQVGQTVLTVLAEVRKLTSATPPAAE